MKILGKDGQAVASIATDVKKKHDSKEFKELQERLANLFEQLFRGWLQDMTPDPKKPPVVRPDAKAVRALWGERWAEQVRAIKAGSIPCEVNEDDLYNAIDKHMARVQEQMRANQPLSQLEDLKQMGFSIVGKIPEGTLWINHNCAVATSAEGMTNLWLRGAHEGMESWCSGWMPRPAREAIATSSDISQNTLNQVLSAIGVANHVPLDADEVHACRQVEKTQRWWQTVSPFEWFAAAAITLLIILPVLQSAL